MGLPWWKSPFAAFPTALPPGQATPNAIDLFNLAIAEKRADGTIDTIAQKYGLMQYAPAGN